MRSGDPYAIRITAVSRTSSDTGRHRARLDELGQACDPVGIGPRQHAVPEIEDVARAARGTVDHVASGGLDALPRPEQHGRIEVSLHAALLADDGPAVVEGD